MVEHEFSLLTNPAFLKQKGLGNFCCHKINISDLVEFGDGVSNCSVAYKVKKGPINAKVTEKVRVTVLTHEKGNKGSARVGIEHKLVRGSKENPLLVSGSFDGREFLMGPNTHISGLPPAGKTSHTIIHGEFIRRRVAVPGW